MDLVVLAGFLKANKIQCSIIDGGGERLTFRELGSRIEKFYPELVIINTSTTTIYHDLKVASLVKAIFRDCLVGAIGVHVMALPEETLQECDALDFVVYSEPEIPILNLLHKGCCEGVKGITYRQAGQIIKNPPEEPVKDMDMLGIPAHDMVPLEIYQEPQMKRRPLAVTMVSRGCINRCVFCSAVFYNHYRVRSVENVIEELKWITKDLKVKELKFYDDGITYNKLWAKKLFRRMLDEKIDLTWNTNIRVDSIDAELLDLMRETGCHTVNLGLESANQTILNNIRKNINLDLVREKIALIKKAGLEICAYFVYGLPGETRQTMKATLDFAKAIDADLVTFNVATPHPGTDFYHYLEKNGYLKTKNWSLYDTNSMPVYDYPSLSGEEIYRYALYAYRNFYMRWSYLKKRILRIDSWIELKNTTRNFIAFFKNFILRGYTLMIKGLIKGLRWPFRAEKGV